MNQAVYDKLVEVAKARSRITYAQLGIVADLDVSILPDLDKLVKILEEIAEQDVKAGRPLVVTVVVREDVNMPAKGLFKWARKHGVQKEKDDLVFYLQELDRVYRHWSSQS